MFRASAPAFVAPKPHIKIFFVRNSQHRTWYLLASESSPSKAEGADLSRPAEAPDPGEIIPESWATSSRNDGRHHVGTTGSFPPESAAYRSSCKFRRY